MDQSHNARKCRRLDGNLAPAELLVGEHLAFTCVVVDRSVDGVGLLSMFDMDVKRGDHVRVSLTPGIQHRGIVQHIATNKGEFRLGVKWMCAHYRDQARAARSGCCDKELETSFSRFWAKLPSTLFSLWQLCESGKLHVMSDIVEQLTSSARKAQLDRIEFACHALQGQLLGGDGCQDLEQALHRLSVTCVMESRKHHTDSDPSASPTTSEDNSEARTTHTIPVNWLGAPSWTVGCTTVLVGLLAC